MIGHLVSISRFAVKGLPGEVIPSASLKQGHGIENDRRYAFALGDTNFDPLHPRPLPKIKFLMQMRYARLARLSARYDDATTTLAIESPEGTLAVGRLEGAEDRATIEQAINAFMGEDLKKPVRLVQADGHRFTDVSVVSPQMMEAVSVINLATVRDLERRLDRPVDARRFRGNLLVDGIEPWSELDWIDREVVIGDVRFRGALRTRRCAATEVNPDTAERDIKLPVELMRNYNHTDLGIYLYVCTDGILSPGNAIRLLPSDDQVENKRADDDRFS